MIDKVLRGNSSQVELFKNLHNYLWNITHDIEKNKPQPLHSKKIIKLKEIILEKLKEADQKILVFCQMKIITRYLCEYLNRMGTIT